MNLHYTTEQITFQEVPNEISLSFLIAGCPLRCKGCHSADSWRVIREANKVGGISKTNKVYEVNNIYEDKVKVISVTKNITNKSNKIHPINSNARHQLTKEYLHTRMKQYQDMISCVLFLGGEWQIKQLIELLQIVKISNPSLKTCLYTGLELEEIIGLIQNEINNQVDIGWKYIFENNLLDYLKTGRWIRELGGLDNKNTNQRFYKVKVKHEERNSYASSSKASEVHIFSQNNSNAGLFTINMNKNYYHNLTKHQLNKLNVKQVLSNMLTDNTWMFQ